MMNPFEFVLAIIAIVFLFKLLDAWLKHKQLRGQAADGETKAELQQRLREIEDRVRVLERIVTDERFDLKRQFKDLEA
jgi:hypothetical protein